MMPRRGSAALLASAAAAWALTGPAAALPTSLALDQSAPAAGEQVTFTAIYPQDARQKLGSRQHENPQVALFCSQAGVRVLAGTAYFPDELNNHDHTWTGASSPVTLAFAGAADCSAALYYYDRDLGVVVLASLSFTAGA